MSRDDLNLYATLVAAVFAVLAFVFSLLTYFRSRSRKLEITTRAALVNLASVAVIRVTSFGQVPVVVEKIAFAYTVWDDSPRLILPLPLKAFRAIEVALNHKKFVNYPSDDAIIRADPLPATISEHGSVSTEIDLDLFAMSVRKRGGVFSSRVYLFLFLLILRVEVITPARSYFRLAHPDIRYYLWKKYSK